MLARELRFHMITAVSAAALVIAVTAWLDEGLERTMVDQESGVDDTTFWASFWYTE